MKSLLFAAAILGLLWVGYLQLEQTLDGGEAGGPVAGLNKARALGPSPFHVTLRDQYLCSDSLDGGWSMVPDPGSTPSGVQEECYGPFTDSQSLCGALERVGEDRIRLYWEGRMFVCPKPE